MVKPIKPDPVFTPELLKIIKIFGLVSILLVIFFSFFNDQRANNSGQDEDFRMLSSARLYFKNVRAIHYNRELRKDAGMEIYRIKGIECPQNNPCLNINLIINPSKDESYIYLEPVNSDWPLILRISTEGKEISHSFENGNKSDHLRYVKILDLAIQAGDKIEMKSSKGWSQIWHTPNELEAWKTLLEDFNELTQ